MVYKWSDWRKYPTIFSRHILNCFLWTQQLLGFVQFHSLFCLSEHLQQKDSIAFECRHKQHSIDSIFGSCCFRLILTFSHGRQETHCTAATVVPHWSQFPIFFLAGNVSNLEGVSRRKRKDWLFLGSFKIAFAYW